jgi:hypothetical protein
MHWFCIITQSCQDAVHDVCTVVCHYLRDYFETPQENAQTDNYTRQNYGSFVHVLCLPIGMQKSQCDNGGKTKKCRKWAIKK